MGKLAILVVMLGILALFAVHNYDTTTINVPFYEPYEISKIGLVMFSTLFGAIAMLLIFIIRDTRRFLFTYQDQRKQKKDERIQDIYSKALNAILANDEVEARANLEEILRVEAEHTDALLRLGDIALSVEKFDDALGYYRRALGAEPGNLEALFSIVNALEKTKKPSEALDNLEKILETDPDNMSALLRKRMLLESNDRWDDVIDVQKTVIKHEHDEKVREAENARLMGYRYELASDSLEKGEFEKANKGFRAILREDEGFVPAYLGVVEVLLGEREPEEAVSFLEKAYETTSNIMLLSRLEDLLITLGEPSRLLRTYRKAISERPGDDMLRFFLAKLYYRLEMIDDALETLAALDTTEPYPQVYRLLGELHLRRDQCAKAVEQFKKLMRPEKGLRLPYTCGACGLTRQEWAGRCPGCENWNTFKFNLHDRRKA
jgi:lipopolysaccharide biosynthesis regulator YciM